MMTSTLDFYTLLSQLNLDSPVSWAMTFTASEKFITKYRESPKMMSEQNISFTL